MGWLSPLRNIFQVVETTNKAGSSAGAAFMKLAMMVPPPPSLPPPAPPLSAATAIATPQQFSLLEPCCNSRSQAISARTPLEIIGCKKISHVPPLLPCRHAEGHLVAQLQHGHLHLARQHVANYRHLAADEASLTDRKVNQPKIWGSQNSEIWFLM